MTGEITLRGRVLPIGGVKEKLLAAHRAGITMIIIPKDNTKDLVELPSDVKEALTIHPVEHVDEVWRLALEAGEPKPDLPSTGVPLWGQQPPADAPTSTPGIE